MSSSLTDLWGTTVDLTPTYISYRNRLVSVNAIQTVHIKGKRLLINTFKQNQGSPTMCIFFASKEDVQEAFDLLQDICFQKKVVVSERSDTWPDIGYAIAICCMVIPVILAIVSAHK